MFKFGLNKTVTNSVWLLNNVMRNIISSYKNYFRINLLKLEKCNYLISCSLVQFLLAIKKIIIIIVKPSKANVNQLYMMNDCSYKLSI